MIYELLNWIMMLSEMGENLCRCPSLHSMRISERTACEWRWGCQRRRWFTLRSLLLRNTLRRNSVWPKQFADLSRNSTIQTSQEVAVEERCLASDRNYWSDDCVVLFSKMNRISQEILKRRIRIWNKTGDDERVEKARTADTFERIISILKKKRRKNEFSPREKADTTIFHPNSRKPDS
jgi:hypothetical protein